MKIFLAICIVCLSLPLLAATPLAKTPLFDVNAQDTDVAVLLRSLATQSGENIVIGQDVKGKVTAQLTQLPLEEIFDHLSGAYGFGWKKTNSAYVINKAELAAAPPPPTVEMATTVWRCRYNTSQSLQDMLKQSFTGLTIAPGPSMATPQLEAETGVTGSSSGGGSSSGSSASTDALKPGSLVIKGPKDMVNEALSLLEKTDVRRPQVSIEAIVTEISDDAEKELGLTWSWNAISFTEAKTTSGVKFGTYKRAPFNFEGTLAALESDGKANLLAKPSLAVVDGGHGSILIGDRILFPKLVSYSSTGLPIYDKQEEKVGIYLQIAPVITDDNYVTMTVYPQVSVIKGYLKTQAGDYPQISTREAKTTVRLKQGERLAIGGLMRSDDLDSIDKVPFLGDLPVIRNLFRHRKTTKVKTEIVIILTPKILTGDEAKP